MRKNVVLLVIALIAIIMVGSAVVDAKGSFGGSRGGGFKGSTVKVSSSKSLSTGVAKGVSSTKTGSSGALTVTRSAPRVPTNTRYMTTTKRVHYTHGMTASDMLPYMLIAYGIGSLSSDNDGNAVYVMQNGTAVKVIDEDGNTVPYVGNSSDNEKIPQSPLGAVVAFAALGAAAMAAGYENRRRQNRDSGK